MVFLAVFDGDRAGWHLDRAALLENLARDWPQAQLQAASEAGSEVRNVIWTYPTGSGPVEAYINKDGTCLYLDGQLRDSAAFAVWFRNMIPPGIEVIFCDEEYTFNVAIPVNGAVDDLVNAASE